jgi:hypothetical protein
LHDRENPIEKNISGGKKKLKKTVNIWQLENQKTMYF